MTNKATRGNRVYRFGDLRAAGVPFSRKHVTTLEKRGDFPMHFNLTEYSVAWVAAEVDAWVERAIRARRPALAGEKPADQPTA